MEFLSGKTKLRNREPHTVLHAKLLFEHSTEADCLKVKLKKKRLMKHTTRVLKLRFRSL